MKLLAALNKFTRTRKLTIKTNFLKIFNEKNKNKNKVLIFN